MTREDRQLLLTDLCARLQYGVYVKDINKGIKVCKIHEMKPSNTYCLTLIPMSDSYHYQVYSCDIDSVRPYLRPMSSMTEEEIIEFNNIPSTKNYTIIENDLPWQVAHYKQIEWLNKKMFDFRGLIPKGHAIKVTKDDSPYNNL